MSGYSRGNPAMGDVLRSVLVLGAIVLGLWLLGQILTVTPDKPTSDKDWQTAASGVEARAGYVPLVPASLPEGWSATRAELVGQRWQLGLVTDDQEYVGLTQQPGDADGLQSLVQERAPGSSAAGDVRIDGERWLVFTGDGETTFARLVDGTDVVVTGSADRAVIEDYVASLEPFSP